MLLHLGMESQDDGESWMEDQWERWLTHDLSLEEFEDEDLSQLTEMTPDCCAASCHEDNVTLRPANRKAGREDGRRRQQQPEEQGEGLWGMLHIELIDAEELHGGERDDQEVESGTQEAQAVEDQGPVPAQDPRLDEGEDEETGKRKRKAALPSVRRATAVAMDTYRPKRPTTLALFAKVPQPQPPPAPQPRTQDTINNNSLEGKKETWKETNSSSPLITGDLTPTQERVRLKEKEDKVQHNSGSTTKPRAKTQSTKHTRIDTHAHPQEKKPSGAPPSQPPRAPKSQRGGAGAGGAVFRDVAQVESGDMGARQSRGQQESRGRPEEEDLLGEKDRDCSQDEQEHQVDETCLSPVVHRNKERPRLSRSSSEGGNRMSIGSDTEGPPGPPHAPLLDRANPSISEEDGEVDVYIPVTARPGLTRSTVQGPAKERGNVDCTKSGSKDGGMGKRADRGSGTVCTKSVSSVGSSTRTVPTSEATAGLSYDSVKYTLVVDEHSKLELVSLKDCYHSYSEEDSDAETVYQSANEDEDPDVEEEPRRRREEKRRDGAVGTARPSQVTSTSEEEEESSSGGGAAGTRKFRNLFSRPRNVGVESFGLFSCVMNGVEREQSHRAAFRFVPRHEDELELETDDPLLMETQDEDLWCQGYNMRTGASGVFPAYYAVKVHRDNAKENQEDEVDRFRVRFLGSAPVPFHKGNDVLCAAMQKIAINRRMAMQPPSACVLEISLKGVKISVQDECRTSERGDKCFHFFQLKNISFCGCHPKHDKYFGFITKHPDHHRFACHVVISEDTSMPLADSVGRAFKQYYKETVGYSCPTEDIFID